MSKSSTKQLVKHSTIYAIGNITRQLAGFLMLPIYTRFLSPADYGAVGLLGFALSLLEPFFGARLMAAVPKFYFEAKEQQTKQAVVTSALLITASISAITAACIYLASDSASQLLFGTTEYALATALFGINILTQPIEYSGLMFMRMREQSMLYLFTNLSKLVVQIALNVLLIVHMKLGVIGIVLGGVISSALYAALLSAYVFYHNKISIDFAMVRRMFIFCFPLWFAGIAGLYIASSNRVFIRVFSSLNDVGLYELGTKFATILSLLLWSPFNQHWETVSFKYYEDKSQLGVFKTTFLGISTLMVLAALGISLFAAPAIGIMSSEAFHEAAAGVPFLTFGTLFQCLVNFFYFSFMVGEKTSWISKYHYLTAAIVTIFYLLMIPEWGHIGAAAALCLTYVVQFVIVYYASRRYFDMKISLLPLTWATAVAGVACLIAVELIPIELTVATFASRAALFLVAAAIIVLSALKVSGNGLYYVEQLRARIAARGRG